MSDMIRVREPAAANVSMDLYEVTHHVAGQMRDIRPATAKAIAAWYQSPGSIGHVLASFASGAAVARSALLDDIARTARDVGGWNDELECLSTFVINYGRSL